MREGVEGERGDIEEREPTMYFMTSDVSVEFASEPRMITMAVCRITFSWCVTDPRQAYLRAREVIDFSSPYPLYTK